MNQQFAKEIQRENVPVETGNVLIVIHDFSVLDAILTLITHTIEFKSILFFIFLLLEV